MTSQDYSLERAVLAHLLGPLLDRGWAGYRGVVAEQGYPSPNDRSETCQRIVRYGKFRNFLGQDEPDWVHACASDDSGIWTEGWIFHSDGKWFWPPRPFDELVEMLRDPAFRERVGLFPLP